MQNGYHQNNNNNNVSNPDAAAGQNHLDHQMEAEVEESEEEFSSTIPLRIDTLTENAELGRFHGHTTPVLSLSYAREANLLLTGGDDESVRLFDVQTKAMISTCRSADWLPSPVRAVAISPDGTRAFIAARENTVKMVRVDNAGEDEAPLRFEGHDHWVRAISLHWPSRKLATTGNDSSVRIWNVDTGQELRRFQGTARAVACGLNDRLVVVGFHDPIVRGYLVDDDVPPIEFTGHTDWVIAISLGTRFLMTGSSDKTARVFDVQSQDTLCVLRGHQQSVNAVALCNSERRGLTGSNDSSVIYWSLENGGSPLLKIAGNFGSVRAITFLSSKHEICFSGWDGSVRAFDLHYLDRMRILAICAAGHDRLGKTSSIKRIVNRDLLAKIRSFLLVSPTEQDDVMYEVNGQAL
jgi:WD40 repeat protein